MAERKRSHRWHIHRNQTLRRHMLPQDVTDHLIHQPPHTRSPTFLRNLCEACDAEHGPLVRLTIVRRYYPRTSVIYVAPSGKCPKLEVVNVVRLRSGGWAVRCIGNRNAVKAYAERMINVSR